MDEKVESEAIDVFAIGRARLDTSVMQLPKLPALLHSVSALFNKKQGQPLGETLTTFNYINIYFLPSSFQSRSYFFTSTVRACSPKCDTEPIQYVTLYFRDQRDAALLRYGNRAKITVLMCEQKPYPV